MSFDITEDIANLFYNKVITQGDDINHVINRYKAYHSLMSSKHFGKEKKFIPKDHNIMPIQNFYAIGHHEVKYIIDDPILKYLIGHGDLEAFQFKADKVIEDIKLKRNEFRQHRNNAVGNDTQSTSTN